MIFTISTFKENVVKNMTNFQFFIFYFIIHKHKKINHLIFHQKNKNKKHLSTLKKIVDILFIN